MPSDGEVVGAVQPPPLEPFRQHRDAAIRLVARDPAPAALARVEAPVRVEHQAVRLVRALAEHGGRTAAGIIAHRAAVLNIREQQPGPIPRRPLREAHGAGDTFECPAHPVLSLPSDCHITLPRKREMGEGAKRGRGGLPRRVAHRHISPPSALVFPVGQGEIEFASSIVTPRSAAAAWRLLSGSQQACRALTIDPHRRREGLAAGPVR